MSRTYVVTGALGCIGAWVVHELLERGDRAVCLDLEGDTRRIADLVGPERIGEVAFEWADVTDADAVRRVVEESGASRIVHLAGLQVPFCKADPSLGARVNVVGTVHVFEAAKAAGARVAYASSAAVYGPPGDGPDESLGTSGARPGEDVRPVPTTHYGVYKLANEGTARVYWSDDGVPSVGLRPLTVFGVGRDRGMTSGPTTALKAGVLGRPFTIAFSGATDFLYARDCADAFLAAVDRAPDGAHALNLAGESVAVERFVELLADHVPAENAARIAVDGPALPLPPALGGGAFDALVPGVRRTSLEDAVAETVARFRALSDAGRLDVSDLPADVPA